MSNAGGSSTDKPLVTFVLLAYNQEKVVREAVESAFAQTYQPLEIILSDDCSGDQTFNIMFQIQKAYEGPHKILVRRSEVNRGIGEHVRDVLALANGDIFVMAAGDDTSFPERVELLVSALHENPHCYAAQSSMIAIEDGVLMKPDPPSVAAELLTRKKYLVGAAAAYRKEVITNFNPLAESVHHEDDALALRALILGDGIVAVEKPLVKYRKYGGSSELTRKNFDRFSYQLKSLKTIEHRLSMYRQWKRDLLEHQMKSLSLNYQRDRAECLFLKSLVTRQSINYRCLWINCKLSGFKVTLFHYLGVRHPKLLHLYFRVRIYFRSAFYVGCNDA